VVSDVLDSRGVPVAEGARLSPGDRLRTGAGARCTVVSSTGALVRIGSSQSVAAERGAGSGIALAVSQGDWSCQLGRDERLEVRQGRHRFRGVRAEFSVEVYQGRAMLTVDAGRLTHVGADGVSRLIEAGESRVID
jgi:hypothetical protein